MELFQLAKSTAPRCGGGGRAEGGEPTAAFPESVVEQCRRDREGNPQTSASRGPERETYLPIPPVLGDFFSRLSGLPVSPGLPL